MMGLFLAWQLISISARSDNPLPIKTGRPSLSFTRDRLSRPFSFDKLQRSGTGAAGIAAPGTGVGRAFFSLREGPWNRDRRSVYPISPWVQPLGDKRGIKPGAKLEKDAGS